MFQEAVDAARNKDYPRARDLLTRLLRTDQSNATYWVWLSAVVDTKQEQIFCLERVLKIDPQNQTARLGLVLFGKLPRDESLAHVPLTQTRSWDVEKIEKYKKPAKEKKPEVVAPPEPFIEPVGIPLDKKTKRRFPIVRVLIFSGLSILALGLIYVGLFGLPFDLSLPGPPIAAVQPSDTPVPAPTLGPTATFLPTNTRVPQQPGPTATFIGPTPLRLLLDVTYTPTPIYVNTPHPNSEAYRSGILAFERNDFENAIGFFNQVITTDPDAVDAYYYIGESHMRLEEYHPAVDAYDLAIDIDRTFAPAYLGRARARVWRGLFVTVLDDLNTAIEYDPNLGEAYIERADEYIRQEEFEAALEDLDVVAELLPDSPLLFLLRAEAYMSLRQYDDALDNALRAFALDQTNLDIYLVLGRAYVAVDQPIKGLDMLETYIGYETRNPVGWLAYGRALHAAGHDQDALSAYNRALDFDVNFFAVYLHRGLAYVELGDGTRAVSDLDIAVIMFPESFAANLGLGRAKMLIDKPGEAYLIINASRSLTVDDTELAQLYYWRALSLEELDDIEYAIKDWEALLELPAESVPEEWITTAEEHLESLTE
jgi:tetratricopeptide (TPR) repeat protein